MWKASQFAHYRFPSVPEFLQKVQKLYILFALKHSKELDLAPKLY